VIDIHPRPLHHPEVRSAFDDLYEYTHILFTSKNTVKVFCDHLTVLEIAPADLDACMIAIGKVTAAHLKDRGVEVHHIAEEETQEGVVRLLNEHDLDEAYIFLPRSSLSRPVLANTFHEREIRFQACDLYDTKTRQYDTKPDLREIDEIVFTSPSTVNAFIEIFGAIPQDKVLHAIGPITQASLNAK